MIIKSFNTANCWVRLVPRRDAIQAEVDGLMYNIPWDKAEDVEFLSVAFGDLRVMDFKVLVAEIGIMYRNKHLYEALM